MDLNINFILNYVYWKICLTLEEDKNHGYTKYCTKSEPLYPSPHIIHAHCTLPWVTKSCSIWSAAGIWRSNLNFFLLFYRNIAMKSVKDRSSITYFTKSLVRYMNYLNIFTSNKDKYRCDLLYKDFFNRWTMNIYSINICSLVYLSGYISHKYKIKGTRFSRLLFQIF